MTDKEKLEKVRAEIERRKKEVEDNIFELGNFESERIGLFDNKEIYNDLLSFIDSMQEEPKDCMYSKDNFTDEDRKVLCDGCEEECKFNKKEEPVSKIDFETEVRKLWMEINTGHSYSIVDSYNIFYGLCMDIADWQKEQLMAKAVDGHVGQTINGMLRALSDETFGDMGFTAGDKVKLIIIKED